MEFSFKLVNFTIQITNVAIHSITTLIIMVIHTKLYQLKLLIGILSAKNCVKRRKRGLGTFDWF